MLSLNLLSVPPIPPPSFTEVRSLRAMDRDAFRSDLEASVSPALCPTFDQLNSVLKSVLDRHAPFTRRAVRTGRSAPWYASIRGELTEAKKGCHLSDQQKKMVGAANLIDMSNSRNKFLQQKKINNCQQKIYISQQK